jgi:hypothetical protein
MVVVEICIGPMSTPTATPRPGRRPGGARFPEVMAAPSAHRSSRPTTPDPSSISIRVPSEGGTGPVGAPAFSVEHLHRKVAPWPEGDATHLVRCNRHSPRYAAPTTPLPWPAPRATALVR